MDIVTGVKRLVVGRRLANAGAGETLLPKRLALPKFASDALSSVAYAPDEILITLSLAGMTGYLFSWQVGVAVALVIAVVVASYRQTVRAYPTGGGDYEVASVNLGKHAGLTVASALLVDYVLTVAVSVSAGVIHAKAIWPGIHGFEVPIAIAVIGFLAVLNLRGSRGFARLLAWPTYIFLLSMFAMLGIGAFRVLVLGQTLRSETADLLVVGPPETESALGWVLVAVIARAFSTGCAALTGIETVTSGVPALRPPKARNAATMLGLVGLLGITMLVGVLLLAGHTGVHLVDGLHGAQLVSPDGVTVTRPITVTGQLARTVFGGWFPIGSYIVVGATIAVLVIAANTSFSGFPSLASTLAKDGFLPRQLHTRGDRLVFSNGILLLAATAAGLVWLFETSVTALIQLYVVGVFISFTLGQTGMIRHWSRALLTEQDRGMRRRMVRARCINFAGAVITGTVLLVVLVSKFFHGAYLALAAMGLSYALMVAIHRHYAQVRAELALDARQDRGLPSRVRAVVLVQQLNLPTLKALNYARASRATSLMAVAIAVDDEETKALSDAWAKEDFGIPLRVISSPYREITQPFLRYVSELRTENPRDVVAVYIPDYVVGRWWESLLHNQTAVLIRARLHRMTGVMVISVPYQLSSSRRKEQRRGNK